MKVVEIFNSIEGEGVRSGERTTFIRLFGCNLKCSYCDTRYGCEGDGYKEMSIVDIITETEKFNCKNVTITGGEPMIHNGIKDLIVSLIKALYFVNIETNGSIDISSYLEEGDLLKQLMFTVDYKSLSSDMNGKMNESFWSDLRRWDVMKFVVGNYADLNDAFVKIRKLQMEDHFRGYIYLSPVWGDIDMKDIVKYMQEHRTNNKVRILVQLHKIIWDPSERGV